MSQRTPPFLARHHSPHLSGGGGGCCRAGNVSRGDRGGGCPAGHCGGRTPLARRRSCGPLRGRPLRRRRPCRGHRRPMRSAFLPSLPALLPLPACCRRTAAAASAAATVGTQAAACRLHPSFRDHHGCRLITFREPRSPQPGRLSPVSACHLGYELSAAICGCRRLVAAPHCCHSGPLPPPPAPFPRPSHGLRAAALVAVASRSSRAAAAAAV